MLPPLYGNFHVPIILSTFVLCKIRFPSECVFTGKKVLGYRNLLLVFTVQSFSNNFEKEKKISK